MTTELPKSLPTSPGHTDPHVASSTSDHPHTYPVVQVEFNRVQTPLIIGIWILSASIAKIGEPFSLFPLFKLF